MQAERAPSAIRADILSPVLLDVLVVELPGAFVELLGALVELTGLLVELPGVLVELLRNSLVPSTSPDDPIARTA